jgi:glutamyl-tRNA synthetase
MDDKELKENNLKLANLLFPNITKTPKEVLKTKWSKHPAFRIAPSPTGQLHIGSVGMALCDYMLAKTQHGKCYIRIEDTDQKREVENAAEKTIETFGNYGITFDNADDIPFQSKRTEIYHVFAKDLVVRGLAFPCFCTEGDLSKMRGDQEARKLVTGYYGEFAKCKTLSYDDVEKKIKKGEKWTLRVILPTATERITWDDKVRGHMSLPAVTNCPVIVKSNGIPPYNLAAAVDDTLMGVTNVLRGEEWIASTAEHLQLYSALNLPAPEFAHLPVICILDNGNKRKLSKRKDRESIAQLFLDDGYPREAVLEYLLTILNTDYEIWRTANPKAHFTDFHFRFEKIGSNSPLFDWDKLNDISKNLIANMSQKEVEKRTRDFFGDKITEDEYKNVFALLAIDRGTDRPRKDIAKFGEIKTEFDYLFKPLKITPLLKRYAELLKTIKDKDVWFANVKTRAVEFGFKNVREFTQALRVELTGRERSTDLYTISKILLGNL